MRSWKFIAIAIIALVLVGNWLVRRSNEVPTLPPDASNARTEVVKSPSPAAPPPSPPMPAPARPEPLAAAPRTEASRASSRRDLVNPLVSSYESASPPPRRAGNADPEVAADFDKIALMFRSYHDITGENPVGTNAEIMKSIMGGNPKSAQLGPPEGQTINGQGELTDRWGTPYFFHQLSKDLMEIHSAGPDRRMGTVDDLVSD